MELATRAGAHRLRRWGFRVAAVCLSLLVVVLVEVAFAAFGLGKDLSLATRVPHQCEVLRFEVNADADRAFCPGEGMAGPEPRRFDIPRPEGVYRIVVIGASTVQGFPYASELAFPRQLEVLLNLQQSRQRVEVLNLGVTGVSSSIVAAMLDESLALEPDLLIVHAGHNEFYGIDGVASTIGQTPRLVRELATAARRSRIGQLVGRLLPGGVPADRDPIEALPADLDIPLDSDVCAAAEKRYRENLSTMVRSALNASVPIILSTVAANHRSHSPVAGYVPAELSDDAMANWRAAFDEGRRFAADGAWDAGLDRLELARAISSESSLLHYRRGECLLGLGRVGEADEAFALAADFDGCRFRAPSTFAGIVQGVVAEADSPSVALVDVEAAIRAEISAGFGDPATDGMPVFLEHVHYSLYGHGLVAETLGRAVFGMISDEEWDDSISALNADFRERLGAMNEDDLVALTFALEVYQREPMSRAFDVERHQQQLASRVRTVFNGLPSARQRCFADLSLDQMADDLPRYLADRLEQNGDGHELLSVLEASVRRQPWSLKRTSRLLAFLRSRSVHQSAKQTMLKELEARCRELGGGTVER